MLGIDTMETLPNYLTFERFPIPELAQPLADMLREHGIPVRVEDSKGMYFDVTFANNEHDRQVTVKIPQTEFIKANRIYDAYVDAHLGTLEKDYYLFDFDNAELNDVLLHPDAWSRTDYRLAKALLAERGHEAAVVHAEKKLEIPGARQSGIPFWIIILLFIFTCKIPFVGLVSGWFLAYGKRTLQTGLQEYLYTNRARNSGKALMWTGAAGCALLLGYALYAGKNFVPYFNTPAF